MDKTLFKLSIVLGKLTKKKERIEKELEELKLDPKVAKYLGLTNELSKTKKEYKVTEKERIFVTCSKCDHLIVQTGYEVDYMEGRSYQKFGCIKCGIDQNLYEYDPEFGCYGTPETLEDQALLEYMKKYKPAFYRNTDLHFINHYDLLEGRKIFLELKAKNKNLTDDELVRRMKKDEGYMKLYKRTTRIW